MKDVGNKNITQLKIKEDTKSQIINNFTDTILTYKIVSSGVVYVFGKALVIPL